MTPTQKARKTKYRAPNYPALAISFLLKKSGEITCRLTSNLEKEASFRLNNLDMLLFGKFVAESELLDEFDKETFSRFCESFLLKFRESKFNPKEDTTSGSSLSK